MFGSRCVTLVKGKSVKVPTNKVTRPDTNMNVSDANALLALRNSYQGLLKYDRYFEEEGRTKEILEEISSQLTCLSVSTKALAVVKAHCLNLQPKAEVQEELPETSAICTTEVKVLDDSNFESPLDLSGEKDLYLVEYENERLQSVQELYTRKKDEYRVFTSELLQQMEQEYLLHKQTHKLTALHTIEQFQRDQGQLIKELREKKMSTQRNGEQELNRRIQAAERQCLLKEQSAFNKRKAQVDLPQALQEYKNDMLSGLKFRVREAFMSCNKEYLSTPYTEWMNRLSEAASRLEELISLGSATETTVLNIKTTLRNLESLYSNIMRDVDQARKRALDERFPQQKPTEALNKCSPQIEESAASSTLQKSTDTTRKRALDERPSPQKPTEASQKPTEASIKCSPQVEETATPNLQKPINTNCGQRETASNVMGIPPAVPSADVGLTTNMTGSPLTPTSEASHIRTETPQKVENNDEHTESEVTVVEEMEECDAYNNEGKGGGDPKPCADDDSASEYWSAVQNLNQLDASLERFKMNPQLKRYRMLLHKAVAINNIGEASGKQLKAKIVHLTNLLLGQSVDCGGKYTSCREDPDAVNYCKNLLAEKIVTQGEEQVQSKIDFAFPFAAVAVALCSKFSDLWELILGHFYVRCPYLVPYQPRREKTQSDTDYNKCLGYKYSDGKVEEITTFLKRMYGYAVLYAAIIQTSTPPGFAVKKTHNIQHGWIWMSRTLNSNPKPDITATLLLAVLEVVGHELAKNYERQFKKILHVLCKDYFSKIKETTGTAGPVGRLKVFLQSAITRGHIPPPKGVINNYFW